MICEWEHMEDLGGYWDTSCDSTFKRITAETYTGEGYENVKYIFCPNCGGKIIEK